MQFLDLGMLSFDEALQRQEEAVDAIARGVRGEVVHLVQHPPVFTLGRAAREENILRRTDDQGRRIPCRRINRGGDVTFHGPGQLVGYPHLDLRRRGRDVHRYLRDLEECLIRTLERFSICGRRRPGWTGVWTERGKIASIGVGVRRWITMHGFALNVNPDLHYFRLIHPCGIPQCPVTSMGEVLGEEISLGQVTRVLQQEFLQVFRPLPDPAPARPLHLTVE